MSSEYLIGSVAVQIYQGDNNYSIVSVKKKSGEFITAKGYNLPQKDKITYKFVGKYVTDKTYGENFVVDYFELNTETKNDIVKYIAKTIDGIGPKTAENFYAEYGNNTIEALKDYGKILAVVNSHKKAEKIYESAKKNLNDKELYFFLMKYEIPMTVITNVANELDNAKEVIEENPFALKRFGVSFQKLNRMAISIGCDLRSTDRIRAAINSYLVETIANKGHLFSFYDDVLKGSLNLLNANSPVTIYDEEVKKVLRIMKDKGEIMLEKCNGDFVIYDAENYKEESYITQHIYHLVSESEHCKKYTANDLKPYIKKYEKLYNVSLSEKQKLAVLNVMNNFCCVITGSAGTGKTTVLKFCINIYKDLFKTDSIQLLAPTGRAARRMSEATNWDAQTIHSKLKIGKDGFVNGDVTDDIVFVDEMSMTGNAIFYKLLNNSAEYTKYVFIGDPQQLPSVESGNVLKDLINAEIVPVVKLDVIYRQMKESLIISNANKIVAGISDFKTGDDFVFVNKTGSVEIQKEVIKIFCNELFDRVNNVNEVQIITPMREKGYLSAKSLNLLIQNEINPLRTGEKTLKVNGYDFRVRDKVICQKNTDEVKNGEIGNVLDIYIDAENKDELTAEIEFYGERLTFTRDDLKELNFALAYAITVHKAQGSEFKSVILPINLENKVMLKRNLLYTAVTRASEKMIIVGSRNHYWDAVKNNAVAPRNTALASRLKKIYIKSFKEGEKC